MPQTVWKGAISFGLVSIPVRLTAATEERDLTFHQVRVSDGSRIRYRRVAEADGEEVTFKDIAKSYRTSSGVDVTLTDEDLNAVRIPSSRTVELVGFVDAASIDPLMLARAYFVEPAADDRKPYVLLRDALVETDRVAVVKLALRNRERLAVLRPRDEVLVIQTMLWPDELRRPEIDVDSGATVRPQELAMARSYIDALSGDLDLTEQKDGYRAALLELVEAKAAGQEPAPPADEDDGGGGQVLDLVEALRRSVAAATGRTAAGSATPGGPTGRPASGKAAAKLASEDSGVDDTEDDDDEDEERPAPAKRAPRKSSPATSVPRKSASKAPSKTSKTAAADSAAKKAPAKRAVRRSA